MKVGLSNLAIIVAPIWLLISSFLFSLQAVEGIRFIINKEDCFSHNIHYERDTVHVSIVVLKADASWQYSIGVDLVDLQVKKFMNLRTRQVKSLSIATSKGLHRFCFTNRSPYHVTIDFDVYVNHFIFDHLATDEHFNPLLQQISKLEEALYNIQFEQHWLEAQTERQAIVNDALSDRALNKAIFESAVLIGGSFLQVFLLRRLFEQKGAPPRL